MPQLKFITRSAKIGEKSVLWISKKGNYYSNVIDAKKDNKLKAIAYTPETGRIVLPPPPPTPPVNTNTFKPAAKTDKTNLIIYGLAAVIAIIILIKIFK